VRFHGRGGQGVVTAAELLAAAAFREGRPAQAFPSFGSERMGAPVMSFCRIDDKPIRTHEPVSEPDALIILDPTLLHQASCSQARPRRYMLINAAHGFSELGRRSSSSPSAGTGCCGAGLRAGPDSHAPPIARRRAARRFAALTWRSAGLGARCINDSSPHGGGRQ